MSYMSRQGELDRHWQDLMTMCTLEQEYLAEHRHPKLLRFLTEQIDKLASEMGFPEQLIKAREFRAEKDGEHISRLIID